MASTKSKQNEQVGPQLKDFELPPLKSEKIEIKPLENSLKKEDLEALEEEIDFGY